METVLRPRCLAAATPGRPPSRTRVGAKRRHGSRGRCRMSLRSCIPDLDNPVLHAHRRVLRQRDRHGRAGPRMATMEQPRVNGQFGSIPLADRLAAPCRDCGQPFERTQRDIKSRHNRCRPCAAKVDAVRTHKYRRGNPIARTWDKAYKSRPEIVEKNRARALVRHAVYYGRLAKGNCEVCGAVPTHGHHDDYSKPLAVRWLCPVHHKQEHDRRAGEGR